MAAGRRFRAGVRRAECLWRQRIWPRGDHPDLRHVDHPDGVWRTGPDRRAGGAVGGLVRRVAGGHRPGHRAVASGHGDVHVRGLRVRHPAGAGPAPIGQGDATGDDARADGRGHVHVHLWRGDEAPGGKRGARCGFRCAPVGHTHGHPPICRTGDGADRPVVAGHRLSVRWRCDHQYPDGRRAAHSLRHGSGWRLAQGLHLPAPAFQDAAVVHPGGDVDPVPARAVPGRQH